MSVIPVDEPPSGTAAATKRGGFWQRLAQALDAYFVDRSMRAVSPSTFRRSKHDIDHCRRLMHKSALAPVEANLGNVSHRRVAQSRPRS